MDNWMDILVPLLGLLFYWLSTSNKKAKKRKASQRPTEVQPPPHPNVPYRKKSKPEPKPLSPTMDEKDDDDSPSLFEIPEREEEPEEEQLSFKDLLERFKNPREYEEELRKRKGPETITKKAERFLDDEYKPDKNFGKPLSKKKLKSIKIREPKPRKKKKFSIKKIVSSPDNIRDAIIMKEIFDRKF